LIGGSIGLAARRRLGAEVTGFDRDADVLARALEVGAIDRSAESLAEAVAAADAVFCAGPVAALPTLAAEALEASGEDAVVTDVGSTKRQLADAIAAHPQGSRFIGGHPLAGAETDGVENARAELFEGARWYLTPDDRSQGVLFDRLHRLLADIGARPQAIDAAEHDRAMATISHLPHVLANVLVNRVADGLSGESGRGLEVGRSFRDTTRVAGANPAVWADILSANGATVADEIDVVIERLRESASLLREGDREAVERWQAGAREDRLAIAAAELSGGELHELRLAVENRPGTVAEIALALGKAGVNIEDMGLFPASDRRTGAISLWIAGSAEAERAAEVVGELGHGVSIVAGGA